ncbi:MAG: copper-transporting ATPase, partial [Parvularculaceae bacterium]|nr:copper-transporting ATPase [Parvularculaceae bacterium]
MDKHHHCHAQANTPSETPGKYDNVPEGYLGTVWTCPMHPQVRETANVGCPICGMALEPETLSLDNPGDTSELDSMTRRLWVGVALSLPLFIYSIGDLIPGRPFENLLPGVWTQWLQFALATPV